MRDCHCGTHVPDDRRTCPECGREVNPGGIDPGIQDQKRSTTIIAALRTEVAELKSTTEAARQRQSAAEDHANRLREALEELAEEHRQLMAEVRELNLQIQAVDERSRLLRARFESLGVSSYRPFDASQAQLFASDFGIPAPADSTENKDQPE